MLLFRCTRNALVELGLPLNDAYPTDSIPTGLLDVWYVNVFRYRRRKCIIFTQEQALYSVVVAGVLKRDLVQIRDLFLRHLTLQAQQDGLAPAAVEQLVSAFGPLAFAKTASRQVIGSMNDQVRLFAEICNHRDGLDLGDLLSVNSLLNESPMKRGKQYILPTQELIRLLAAPHSSAA